MCFHLLFRGIQNHCYSFLILCILQNIILCQLYLFLNCFLQTHHYKHASLSTLTCTPNKCITNIFQTVATHVEAITIIA
jgi:hypothetical protein